MEPPHFDRDKKRNAEFIAPQLNLKSKVGSGGLSDEVLNEAQGLLENNTVDFAPIAKTYLDNLLSGIELAKADGGSENDEKIIAMMLYPAMQLKANGGMFHYILITQIADRLVQFLEVIEGPNIEAIEIVLAYHTTMHAVLAGKIKGDGGSHGQTLYDALNDACMRYFDKML